MKRKLKSILHTRFFRNTSWIICCRVYQTVLNFIVALLTARYLGPSNYGLINYAASLTALMTAFATLGTNETTVNELVTQPEQAGTILGSTIFYRLSAALLSLFTILLYTAAANPQDPLTVAVTGLYSLSLLFQSFEIIKLWYQANLLSKIPSIISCVAYTVVAAYKVVLLVCGKSVIWFAAANTIDYALIAALLLVAYHKNGPSGQPLKVRVKASLPILRRSRAFIVSGLMVSIYGQMDKIMLKQMLSQTHVGYYSVATAICTMWPFILVAIIDSARPLILADFKKDTRAYETHLRQLYTAIIYISFFAALAISILARPIILLLYGADYLPATNALRIVCWYTAFSYLGVARSIYLIPNGLQRYEKWIALAGALSNLALNALLIPQFGINGAAFATLLTQVITNFIIGFFLKEIRRNNQLILQSLNIFRSFKE